MDLESAGSAVFKFGESPGEARDLEALAREPAKPPALRRERHEHDHDPATLRATGLLGAAVAGRAISARSGPAHGPAARDPRTRYATARRDPAPTGARARAVPLAGRHREPRAPAARGQLPVPRALARRRRGPLRWGTRASRRSTRSSSTTSSRSSSARTRGTSTCSSRRSSSTASTSGTAASRSARRSRRSSSPILDLLGRIAGKPFGQLIGEIHHPQVGVYQATEYREKPVEESLELIQRDVAEYDARAAQDQGRRAHVHDHRHARRRPAGTDRGDHPARPQDVRRPDGALRRRQRLLLGRGGDPRRHGCSRSTGTGSSRSR